jgi:hypothetical protein
LCFHTFVGELGGGTGLPGTYQLWLISN